MQGVRNTTSHYTARLIAGLSATHQLMAKLIYGSGIRLMECLRLRVKACPERRNLEFERRAIIVRDGKGAQDRVTVLSARGKDSATRFEPVDGNVAHRQREERAEVAQRAIRFS